MFTYCGNSPVMNFDPIGTSCQAIDILYDNGPGYIYNQRRDPHGSKKLRDVTVSYGGCGVVASYNALISLGNPKDFDEILAYFNADSGRTFMNGRFGILPWQVADYFNSLGYQTVLTDSPVDMYDLSKCADACILFYMFPQTVEILGVPVELFGAHYVEYEAVRNQFVGRNTDGKNGMTFFKSPSAFGYSGDNFYAIAILIFE